MIETLDRETLIKNIWWELGDKQLYIDKQEVCDIADMFLNLHESAINKATQQARTDELKSLPPDIAIKGQGWFVSLKKITDRLAELEKL